MTNRTPIENEDSLVITLSVSKNGSGNGRDISFFLDDGYIKNEGELKNIASRAASLLWEILIEDKENENKKTKAI